MSFISMRTFYPLKGLGESQSVMRDLVFSEVNFFSKIRSMDLDVWGGLGSKKPDWGVDFGK